MVSVKTGALVCLVALTGCGHTGAAQFSAAAMDRKVETQLMMQVRNACLRERMPRSGAVVYTPDYQHPFIYCTNTARAQVQGR